MLAFNLLLKDIKKWFQECKLSNLEAEQLVKDYTSGNVRGAAEFYLYTNSTWGCKKLIEHIRRLFEIGKTFSFLVGVFTAKSTTIRRLRISLQSSFRYLVERSLAFAQSGRLKWTKPRIPNSPSGCMTNTLWLWHSISSKCYVEIWCLLSSKLSVYLCLVLKVREPRWVLMLTI